MEKTNNYMSKANSATPDPRNKIAGGEHNLEVMAKSAGEKIGSMASELAASTANSMVKSREYIKESPGKSVAIAAATGFVLGGLVTLMSRRRKE